MKLGLIDYSRNCDYACILDSHSDIFGASVFPTINYDLVAGFGYNGVNEVIACYEDLEFIDSSNDHWLLGYLGYDLKNRIEQLDSANADYLHWPEVFFFHPEIMYLLNGSELTIISDKPQKNFFPESSRQDSGIVTDFSLELKPRISKEEYIRQVSKIKRHIQLGDIYEINYCQEFYDNRTIDPYSYYKYLKTFSPSPFSAFFKYYSNYLISASPERFLQKKGNLLISQPIKGTASRSGDLKKDQKFKFDLENSVKERSENIMIVDLVRNDLSRLAIPNTVKVEELCSIHAFPQVYQMISTVSAEIMDCPFRDIIQATFPMGSMTGAPKIAAMKLAERYEQTRRGLYSGAVGYIAPSMDFDFNVVIRSLQYNSKNRYLSYMTGSAITALSIAENEYHECLLKAYGLNKKYNTFNYA